MKLDFDTFEFAALIAPGSVVVIALALLYPQILQLAQPAALIAAGLVSAYVSGHLVAALGNLAEPVFSAFSKRIENRNLAQWVSGGYILEAQKSRVETLAVDLGLTSFDAARPRERKIVLKQMRLSITSGAGLDRLETFNGLYNLSRNLTIAFTVTLVLCFAFSHYAAGWLCLGAAVLALLRVAKFNAIHSVELVQTYLADTRMNSATREVERAFRDIPELHDTKARGSL